MAAKALRRYQIVASFQTKRNEFKELNLELEAENGQQVWDALQEMAEEDGTHLVAAQVREIDPGTGEVTRTTNVRTKNEEQPAGAALPALPAPQERAWYEGDAFVNTYLYVIPCTYKTKEEEGDTTAK